MPSTSTSRSWDGPALPRAATILAEEYAGPEGLDLRGVVVVTPGARAGRRLVELLLEQAEAHGCQTVDGLGMLLHQAVPGFERWFSYTPMVDDELREAVLS